MLENTDQKNFDVDTFQAVYFDFVRIADYSLPPLLLNFFIRTQN